MPKQKGLLIVIDGTDGSGKGTQTKLLTQRLKQNNFPVKTTDFPQYGKKSAGPIEEYLNGKYGSAQEVGPYRASILYAIDRYDASFQMKKWLDQGFIIISNRYVSANMGHQGAKIKSKKQRQKFLDWLYDLEYNIFKIPKPDLNIILHVPSKIAFKLIEQKNKRSYLKNKKRDIHEADIKHLQKAEQVYLEIAQKYKDFTIIECAKDNKILSKQEISDLLWQKIYPLIKHLQKNKTQK